MNEKPILFSTDMVKAILEKRKTQTRRIAKINPMIYKSNKVSMKILDNSWWDISNRDNGVHHILRCPYGEIGDILWVRETWGVRVGMIKKNGCEFDSKDIYLYKADYSWVHQLKGWKPSIHMPKVACRIRLKIINIKLQRLGEISDLEAAKEGVVLEDEYRTKLFINYISSFVSTWCKVHKSEDAWQNDINKYVWVITFERI